MAKVTKFFIVINEEKISSKDLDKLLRYVLFNQIKHIDALPVNEKIEKGLYDYLNTLSTFYELAEQYSEAILIEEFNTSKTLQLIIDYYNQERYISREAFIKIEKEECPL